MGWPETYSCFLTEYAYCHLKAVPQWRATQGLFHANAALIALKPFLMSGTLWFRCTSKVIIFGIRLLKNVNGFPCFSSRTYLLLKIIPKILVKSRKNFGYGRVKENHKNCFCNTLLLNMLITVLTTDELVSMIVLKYMPLKYIPAILYWHWKYFSLHTFVFQSWYRKKPSNLWSALEIVALRSNSQPVF